MICVDGDKVRFVLLDGHVEVVIDSRKSLARNGEAAPACPAKHSFFDDGIYGI